MTSQFVVSLFATPHSSHQEVFYTVPRAGHLVGGVDHHVKRNHFPGHELIFCIAGEGFVRIAGRMHPVRPGDIAWVNCHQPHEHGANSEAPWEVLWVRVEGPQLESICRMLSVNDAPVFTGISGQKTAEVYASIFDCMQRDAPDGPAQIHAEIARLLAIIFSARFKNREIIESVPSALQKSVQWMRLFYFENTRVSKLAKIAGLSSGHFSRLFKLTFGTSPIEWLRRERISQAKRRLVESRSTIKEIAEQVGYPDRFFFSKDFKRYTGFSPRAFRQRESSGSAN